MSGDMFYVVMCLSRWEDTELTALDSSMSIQVQKSGEYIGYLPVFQSEEAARQEYPEMVVRPIAIDQEKNNGDGSEQ